MPGKKETRLYTTMDLYEWARSALQWPKKAFFKEKKGRGIWRRWMWHLPTHGPGAVDYRQQLKCYPMEQTLTVHQIRGNGGAGKLLTRDRSCHQCDACWGSNGDWSQCENEVLVGEVWPVTLPPPDQVI